GTITRNPDAAVTDLRLATEVSAGRQTRYISYRRCPRARRSGPSWNKKSTGKSREFRAQAIESLGFFASFVAAPGESLGNAVAGRDARVCRRVGPPSLAALAPLVSMSGGTCPRKEIVDMPKAMTKSEIAAHLAEKCGISKKQVNQLMEAQADPAYQQ